MTDEIFLRYLISENLLNDCSLIITDEAYERKIYYRYDFCCYKRVSIKKNI